MTKSDRSRKKWNLYNAVVCKSHTYVKYISHFCVDEIKGFKTHTPIYPEQEMQM